MKRGLFCAVVGAVLLGAVTRNESRLNAQGVDAPPLGYFKNFFVTGDYVTGAVGLQGLGVSGLATGSIPIDGVPAGADIVAAYLYWQSVTNPSAGSDSGSIGARFNGYPLSSEAGPFAKALGDTGALSCGTTSGTGGERRTYTYRTDVLRFFPIGADGKFDANGQHTVQVPDSGPGGAAPVALGATLVVVYRDPSRPLSAVVLYDGTTTIDSNHTLTQKLEGFYQAGPTPDGRITYIAGGGQANRNETLGFNGSFLAEGSFASGAGASWDTVTFPVNPGPANKLSTFIGMSGLSLPDCVTLGAIVFKTAVQDSDGDGLVDLWETSTQGNPVLDPNGHPLPPLAEMGAHPLRKDLFVEIGYTKTDVDLTYGGVPKPAHSHLPGHEALKRLGDAYWNAPVSNPDGSFGITMHVDAGDSYPAGEADGYIVPRHLARGGEFVDEAASTQCTRGPLDPPWVCQFGAYPGTVGWKTGFRFLKDEILSGEPAPLPGQEDVCDLPGNTCVRRFDRERKDIFHYLFFAHAVGLPVAEEPCFDGLGNPAEANPISGLCDVAENPQFRVPRTTTGVGDFPGGDALVTMGAFLDTANLPVGTPFTQASTAMHEFGHNFERRHSGESSTPTSPNANCKPTYLSVMNYLYQLRGLLDDAGRPQLDYSGQIGPTLNEQALLEGIDYGSWQARGPYRIGWYAPLVGSYLEDRVQPATKHCDGSPLLPTDVPMVRVDARTAGAPIDWNANGAIAPGFFPLDINFNGRTTAKPAGETPVAPELLTGSDDWSNIRLNQLGSRRSVGGFFVDAEGTLRFGPLSLDAGRADMGRADMGRADMGRADMGRADMGLGDLNLGDTGRADMGRADMGRADMGRADMGRGDEGGGDLFRGDPNSPIGELDFTTANSLGKTPPIGFTACVVGVGNCTAPQGSGGTLHQVLVTFEAPNFGGVRKFVVMRVAGATLLPGVPWNVAAQIDAVPGQQSYFALDTFEVVDGTQYTYFAGAVYEDGVVSDASNMVTITAQNNPPSISAIPNQSIPVNGTTGPLAFTFTDERPEGVTLTAFSSDFAVVPNANIALSGTGTSRTVTVTPAANATGSAVITVVARDAGSNASARTFVVTVGGSPPTFHPIPQ